LSDADILNPKWHFLETFGFVTYASTGAWHAAVTKGLNMLSKSNYVEELSKLIKSCNIKAI